MTVHQGSEYSQKKFTLIDRALMLSRGLRKDSLDAASERQFASVFVARAQQGASNPHIRRPTTCRLPRSTSNRRCLQQKAVHDGSAWSKYGTLRYRGGSCFCTAVSIALEALHSAKPLIPPVRLCSFRAAVFGQGVPDQTE